MKHIVIGLIGLYEKTVNSVKLRYRKVVLMLVNFDSQTIINTDANHLIQTRMSLSEYENPNITAYKLLFSVISMCYLVQFKKINSKLGYIIIIFLFAGMMLTGSRKTFLIILPALAIYNNCPLCDISFVSFILE